MYYHVNDNNVPIWITYTIIDNLLDNKNILEKSTMEI